MSGMIRSPLAHMHFQAEEQKKRDAQAIRDSFVPQVQRFSESVEDDLHLPPYLRPSYPQRAVEPKIMIPYVVAPGQVPRRVAVQRRKDLYYSLDIAELLEREGFTGNHAAALAAVPVVDVDAGLPAVSRGGDGKRMMAVRGCFSKHLMTLSLMSALRRSGYGWAVSRWQTDRWARCAMFPGRALRLDHVVETDDADASQGVKPLTATWLPCRVVDYDENPAAVPSSLE